MTQYFHPHVGESELLLLSKHPWPDTGQASRVRLHVINWHGAAEQRPGTVHVVSATQREQVGTIAFEHFCRHRRLLGILFASLTLGLTPAFADGLGDITQRGVLKVDVRTDVADSVQWVGFQDAVTEGVSPDASDDGEDVVYCLWG